MPEQPSDTTCPYCRRRAIQAIATLPTVRGKGLGARFKARTIAGCKRCVRKQLLLETLRSSVDGWASPAAVLANPVLIIYGLARAGAVYEDPARVRRMLEAAGLAEAPIDPVRIAYGLAAALIRADGRIDPQEIRVAAAIGTQVFPGFDENDFQAAIEAGEDLPRAEDLARVLNDLLDARSKDAVYRFLLAIAAADREVAAEEQAVLRTVAKNLGLEGPGLGLDESV